MNVDISKNYTALKNELTQKGIADAVTTATSPATGVWWHTDIDQWPGKKCRRNIEMGEIITSQDYFKAVGMTFSAAEILQVIMIPPSVVFNENCYKKMRIKNPVSQIITWAEHSLKLLV
jgi:hypothetical protein